MLLRPKWGCGLLKVLLVVFKDLKNISAEQKVEVEVEPTRRFHMRPMCIILQIYQRVPCGTALGS